MTVDVWYRIRSEQPTGFELDGEELETPTGPIYLFSDNPDLVRELQHKQCAISVEIKQFNVHRIKKLLKEGHMIVKGDELMVLEEEEPQEEPSEESKEEPENSTQDPKEEPQVDNQEEKIDPDKLVIDTSELDEEGKQKLNEILGIDISSMITGPEEPTEPTNPTESTETETEQTNNEGE